MKIIIIILQCSVRECDSDTGPVVVLLQISFHLKEKFSSVAKDISRSPPPPVSKGVAPIWHGNLIVQWTKTPSLPLDISFAFRVAPETLLSSGFFP